MKKPKKKYRPKGILINPLGYVLESLTPVSRHDSFLLLLKIRNHDAMHSLTKGVATEDDMRLLTDMNNITEALMILGFNGEEMDVVKRSELALNDIKKRFKETGKLVLKSHEMMAINDALDVHDEIMELITVKDMERATALVEKEAATGKMKLAA